MWPTSLEILSTPRTGVTLTHLKCRQGPGESRRGRTLAGIHQNDQPQVPHLLPGERRTVLTTAGKISSKTSFFISQ